MLVFMAGFLAFAPPTPLETARDLQDRPALRKLVKQYPRPRQRAPNDAEAPSIVWRWPALIQAEVAIELHDKKAGQQAAERGIRAGEKAVSLKPRFAEYYRVLGTLYGQAIVDIPSGLSYGAKAKDAINQGGREGAEIGGDVRGARGGEFLSAGDAGGRPEAGDRRFSRRPSSSIPRNAEAYLWLGVSCAETIATPKRARRSQKSLELESPARVDQAAVGQDPGEIGQARFCNCSRFIRCPIRKIFLNGENRVPPVNRPLKAANASKPFHLGLSGANIPTAAAAEPTTRRIFCSVDPIFCVIAFPPI